MPKLNYILVTICLFSFSVSGNEKPVLHHFTTEDGLFHNEIRIIKKAKNGMLWLGTQNGLSSFDGYRFTVYKHNKNNPHSLCSDKIYSLETSAINGNIWVGTTNGLCILNSSTNKAIAFPDTFRIKTQLPETFIKSLFEDRAGYLWIAASSGNFRYSAIHQTMEKILPGKNIIEYFESREGIFWICHDGLLSKYNRKTDEIIKSYPYQINKLYTDRFGVLWAVGGRGLYRYMPGKADFELLPHVQPKMKEGFSSITEDRNGRLFLGIYGGGITIFDPKTNQVQHLIAHPNIQDALSSNDVYDVFSDHSGVIWIGTQEGLDVYDWSRQRFRKWEHDPEIPDGLSNNFIQSIYRDNNDQLWLGTRDSGLELYKGTNANGDPVFQHFPSGETPGELIGKYINSTFHDSKNRFWVASWGGGLNLKEPGSVEWINFQHKNNNPNSIAGNAVTSVLEDRRGRIWVGTLSGLSRLNQDEHGHFYFQNYSFQKDNPKSLSANNIFKIFEDSKGRIWLAINDGGLNLMHEGPDGRIWFEHFMNDPENPKSISNNEVFIIFEDSKQRLWTGTSLKGFNRVFEEVDANGKSRFWFKSYQEKDGLSDNEVNAILEDDFGNLWISTNKGLSKFNPEDETFVNYSEYDGVLKGKFRKNAAWKDEDGTMYFGGAAGVNIFNSTRFPKNQIPPSPEITGIFIDGKQYFENDSLKNKPLFSNDGSGVPMLLLTKETNRFEVQFSAMSFTSPKRNKYRWKLHGFDENWHTYEGDHPKAIYNALPSGSFHLQIQAANNDGVWSTLPAQLIVKIGSGTSTFIAITFAGLSILILGLFFLFRKKKKSSKKRKAIPVSEEDRQLIDQLNSLMEQKQLFLDCKLGLNDLADELKITPNQLSALLNEQMGKPFYDYVNEFRIEEIKHRLVDPKEKNKTILTIAWECGFNSKSAFNRVFKLSTGLTPSEYQKKHS